MKGIPQIVGSETPDWILFARDHVDLQYHFAKYEREAGQPSTSSSNGLTLALRVWPW